MIFIIKRADNMEINLIYFVLIYLMILTYRILKENIQEIVLDMLRLIITPIGMIIKLMRKKR